LARVVLEENKGIHHSSCPHDAGPASPGWLGSTTQRACTRISPTRPRSRPSSSRGSGSRAYRCLGGRRAGPSLPVLWLTVCHHRNVRGQLDAPQQTDRVHDRSWHRHVMMVIATISHLTTDRLCCWLMLATMGLGPITLRGYGKGPATPCTNANLMPLRAGNGGRCPSAAATADSMTPTLLRPRQPNTIAPVEPGGPQPAPCFLAAFERQPSCARRRSCRLSETRHISRRFHDARNREARVASLRLTHRQPQAR
jgi:hypothetical protein